MTKDDRCVDDREMSSGTTPLFSLDLWSQGVTPREGDELPHYCSRLSMTIITHRPRHWGIDRVMGINFCIIYVILTYLESVYVDMTYV